MRILGEMACKRHVIYGQLGQTALRGGSKKSSVCSGQQISSVRSMCGALVESTPFVQKVMGSTPALAAT